MFYGHHFLEPHFTTEMLLPSMQVKRYKTYVRLLQYKLAAFAELEPRLAETAIGEVDEPEHESAAVAFVTGHLVGFDISAVNSDIGHPHSEVEVASGLGTVHEV